MLAQGLINLGKKSGSQLDRLLEYIESGLLVGLLGSMMLLAVYQVVLRNFFDIGLVWGDAYVRVSVFWIALIGALAASRNDEHIQIDLLSRLLPSIWRARVGRVIALITSILCFAGAWHSYVFVQYEYQDGIIAFAEVPAWMCEAVMPVVLVLIALRYLGRTLGFGIQGDER